MKPWYESKTVWVALLGVIIAIADYATDWHLPPGVYAGLMAAAGVARTIRSNLTATDAKPPIGPGTILALGLIIASMTGCAATWPAACPLVKADSGYTHACKCAEYKIALDDKAKLGTQSCDGASIPVRVTYEKAVTP
jgi:hypothetical protein